MSAENELKKYRPYFSKDPANLWFAGMEQNENGNYIKLEDYESLRRATVSMETAQKLADSVNALRAILKDMGASGTIGNDALAAFNKEKGGQG